MSFFSKLKDAAATAVGSTINSAKENSKLIGIRAELTTLQADVDSAYLSIGRKYVDYVSIASENDLLKLPNIGVHDTLVQLGPKLEKRTILENELAKIELELQEVAVMQERAVFEKEHLTEKDKLDKAKKMGILSESEYNEKIIRSRKKLDNFVEIRRLEKQLAMGLIDRFEFDQKISPLV